MTESITELREIVSEQALRIQRLEARIVELQKNQDISLELEETTGFYHIGKNASTQYTLKLIRTQNKEVLSEIYLDFTPLSEDS